MVKDTNLTNELKNYNKELEEYLGNINIGNALSEINLFEDSDGKEMLPLISSGILDIKTSMDLMRRDLINNVENILIKSMQENQKKFFKQMDSFSQNMFVKLKGLFSTQLTELYNEISDLKSNSKKLELSIKEINEHINDFNGSLYELKTILEEINNSKSHLEKIPNLLKKIDRIEEGFEKTLSKDRFEVVFENFFQEIKKFGIEINTLKVKIDDSKNNSELEKKKTEKLMSKFDELGNKFTSIKDRLFEVQNNNELESKKILDIGSKFENFDLKFNEFKNNLSKNKTKNISKEEVIEKKIINKENNNSVFEKNDIENTEEIKSAINDFRSRLLNNLNKDEINNIEELKDDTEKQKIEQNNSVIEKRKKLQEKLESLNLF